MKLIYICLGSLILGSVVVVGLTLPGCESDPLLAPQSEVSEEGGSYGNTNLPASGTNDAKNDANPRKMVKPVTIVPKIPTRNAFESEEYTVHEPVLRNHKRVSSSTLYFECLLGFDRYSR